MPIYDFECCMCGHIHEAITDHDELNRICPNCNLGMASRIISQTGQYCGNQDATWLKSVGEVVEHDTPEGREFIKNPTRDNRQRWMKAKGLIEYEPGMRTRPDPTQINDPRTIRKLAERAQARRAISIRSS